MKRNLVLRLSLLANAGLMALTALFAARPNVGAYATVGDQQFEANSARNWHRIRSRRHGFHHFCSDRDGAHLDALAAFAEARLDLNADQGELLGQLTTNLKTNATEPFDAICAELPSDNSATSAPERLSQLQAVLDAGSAAIAQVRPSFDAFYASLTDAQQQEVDGWLSQWREHRYDSQEYE